MSSTEREGISLDGRRYFLASEAAADFGFSGDYIARLARQGKINGRRVGKKWYVETESLRAYLKVLGEPSRPASLFSKLPDRTSAQQIAHAMHAYGRHTMRDWSVPDEPKKRSHPVSPVLPLASLALAVLFIIAAAYATFNGTRASTIASRVQSQFAAASAETSFFDRAAEFLWRAVCPIFGSCDQYDVRSADSQYSGGADQAIARQPLPTVSTPSTSSGQASSPPADSGSFASTLPAAGNMPLAERVIERIVERAIPTYAISYSSEGGGVTEAILNDRLDQLENKLSNRIFSLSASLVSVPNSLPATGGVTNTIALTQRIDNLDGTDISNPTITGGTITDATISGGNIMATALSATLGVGSGGTGTSTSPAYGQVLLGQSDGTYALVATSSLGIGGGITPGSDAILGTATTTNLYVSGMFSGAGLTSCNAPGSKLVYNASTNQFECSQDLMGSGGAGVWSTTTDSLAISPANTSYVVLVGSGATTTTGNILEVNGNARSSALLSPHTAIVPPVQCLDKDYLETSKWFYYAENGGDIKYKNYVPFIVHEPAENISGNDTSLLSCGALSGSEQDCTASAAGSVPLSFNFDTTVGKFYARWITFGRDVAKYDPGQTGSCGGAKSNLLIKPGGYWPGQTEWGAGSWQTFYGNGTGFSDHVEIGPESIPYTIDIVPATDGPTTPVISGGSCVIGAPYSISFVSTDPNGHQLKYGIDWDDDGTLDQFVPPSGFVPSGTSQSASRMNAIAGQKTVRVLAQNEQGASSEWSTYSFDCSEAVTTCEDDQTLVQGVCLDFFTSCPVGYVKNGIQCVWNGCPVGYTQQADNVCIWSGCPEGYVEQSNRQCVLLSECSALPYCSGPNLYNGCTHEIIQSCEWGCANGVCKGTPSPTGSLQAAPSVVQKDHFTTITWSSSHASACTVTSTNNDTWTGLSGIQQSNPLQAQTTFYLHCEGLEDSSTATLDKSVIVNVVPNYEEK